jgi:predicted nucleic acid-binding Zn ribbon protein
VNPANPVILAGVLPIQLFSAGVLADIVRRQPPSPARTSFAWQMAVGPAIARVTTVELVDGVLTVRASDTRWSREVARARPMILGRLQEILGSGDVKVLRVEREAR